MYQDVPVLQGAPNFREVGGYPARGGRHIRPGLVYRSQGLHALTDADVDAIRRLDIRLVCDLRSHAEQALHPSRWPAGMPTQRLDLNIQSDVRANNKILLDMLRAHPGAEGARAMMLYSYSTFPHTFGVGMRRVFAAILGAPAGLPALVHCSAGKDRTGFVVAMILSALGVDRETIFQDYMETQKKINLERLMVTTEAAIVALLGVSPGVEALEVISSVSPDFLNTAFKVIDDQFGSVDRYLHEVCGLDRSSLEHLDAAMLV